MKRLNRHVYQWLYVEVDDTPEADKEAVAIGNEDSAFGYGDWNEEDNPRVEYTEDVTEDFGPEGLGDSDVWIRDADGTVHRKSDVTGYGGTTLVRQ